MGNQEFMENDANTISVQGVDLDKLKSIFLKSLPAIALIILFCLSASFLAIRYTKQLFQSSSTLQLDIKSEAKVLGFKSFDDDINNLAREIEIIKSKLFLNKVVEALNYDVSYFQYGDILYEERYGNSPFEVKVISCAPELKNIPIDLVLIDHEKFTLSYVYSGAVVEKTFQFSDTIDTKGLTLFIELSPDYISEAGNKYFFTLNTHNSTLEYIDKNLTVEPLDFKANTITISFKDHTRQKATDIVHAIDTLYLYYTQLEKNKANNQKINFLNEQLNQTEEKLTELENYFENFTIDNRTTDLDENLSETIVFLNQLDSQQYSIRQKITAYEDARDNIMDETEMSINASDVALFSNEVKDEFYRLNTLIEEKKILLISYNKNTLAYQKKQQEINTLKERLVQYIDSSKEKLVKNLEETKTKRKEMESAFVGLPSKRTEYSKTERFYGLYEEFYLTLMQNKAEFQLAEAGTVTDFKILSSASSPSLPISPNKVIYYGIGLVAGLILSFIFIGVRYLLNNKINSQQELERITTAFVLGSVPYYTKEKTMTTRLVVNNNLKSEISEAFRSIRTNLEFLNNRGEKPVIAITSTVSGEGKTFVAANLGGIISLLKNKVVLIDLDMRKPRFHEVFEGTNSQKGLSTILIKKHSIEECIQKTDLENMDYIPAGPIPPNPSELILGGPFDELMAHLKSKYDVIIIDTPPVGLVTDGIHALKIASIPIYVVRADFSKKVYLNHVNRMIKVHKLNNLSLVLNSVRGSAAKSYGHGYYDDTPSTKSGRLRQIFQS